MNRIEDILYHRQIEVLELLALGSTTKEIAVALNFSVKTAEHHRAEIYHALNIHDPVMLAHFAIHHGIVPVIEVPMPKARKPTRGHNHCLHEYSHRKELGLGLGLRRSETCGFRQIVNPFGDAI